MGAIKALHSKFLHFKNFWELHSPRRQQLRTLSHEVASKQGSKRKDERQRVLAVDPHFVLNSCEPFLLAVTSALGRQSAKLRSITGAHSHASVAVNS